MKRLVTIIIASFFMSSCYYATTTKTHYELEASYKAQKKINKSIKSEQATLGWITLPPINKNKNLQINIDKEKYKLIRTEYLDEDTLSKILKRDFQLYYDIDSISKSHNGSEKVIKIKTLRTYKYQADFISYMNKRTILSHYELPCSTKNKILRVIDEMWWNGSWFTGIRYTFHHHGGLYSKYFPKARLELDNGDYKILEKYNNLLCDVANNKNEKKAELWLKNKSKREAKVKEEKERKAKKIQQEKERKAKKIQQEKERKAKKVREDKRRLDLDKASQTCLDLGFKKGTKKYKDCIVELL